MDREKQIEEMAKDIENTILGLGFYLCRKSAEKLLNLGYRKLPDVATVLLVGKYNQALDEKTIEYFIKHNEQIRKETAREILQCLYDKCYETQISRGGFAHITPLDILDLAKIYGMEAEE